MTKIEAVIELCRGRWLTMAEIFSGAQACKAQVQKMEAKGLLKRRIGENGLVELSHTGVEYVGDGRGRKEMHALAGGYVPGQWIENALDLVQQGRLKECERQLVEMKKYAERQGETRRRQWRSRKEKGPA